MVGTRAMPPGDLIRSISKVASERRACPLCLNDVAVVRDVN
jgi:hypothetical protein